MLSSPKIEMLRGRCRFQSANLQSHITLFWYESVRHCFISAMYFHCPKHRHRLLRKPVCRLPVTPWEMREGWGCGQLQGPHKPLPSYWPRARECSVQTCGRLFLHVQMHKHSAEGSQVIKWETPRAGKGHWAFWNSASAQITCTLTLAHPQSQTPPGLQKLPTGL